jgi:hypothetical protein
MSGPHLVRGTRELARPDPTDKWWVLPVAVPLELPHNEFMNNLEKITIGLLVLMSAAGISGWLLFNYMLDSIV